MKNVTDDLRYHHIHSSIPVFNVHNRVETYVKTITHINIKDNIMDNVCNDVLYTTFNIYRLNRFNSQEHFENAYNIMETI